MILQNHQLQCTSNL